MTAIPDHNRGVAEKSFGGTPAPTKRSDFGIKMAQELYRCERCSGHVSSWCTGCRMVTNNLKMLRCRCGRGPDGVGGSQDPNRGGGIRGMGPTGRRARLGPGKRRTWKKSRTGARTIRCCANAAPLEPKKIRTGKSLTSSPKTWTTNSTCSAGNARRKSSSAGPLPIGKEASGRWKLPISTPLLPAGTQVLWTLGGSRLDSRRGGMKLFR